MNSAASPGLPRSVIVDDRAAVDLVPPNALPRPAEELRSLEAAWEPPKGWRLLSEVSNTYVGAYYVATACLFFVLAGALALLMRTQLAVAENDLVSPALYNQLFTMHGTVMMFLFAVPAVEAMGVLLLPNMLGARDLPFPRLGAYAFWAYFFGGLAFFCSLFFGVAPDGGWFMYPPLTSTAFSQGVNADFWLLGIGFIEISAIAGAIEIIVGVLRTRAPGMSLDKLPIYAWAMLVLAAMIVFAFPAVILATTLLELERAFDWPFFIAERGGDPVLWQHLFWFFGHPEVYIIFLPAAGMVSMIIPAMARIPLAGYRYVVLALVGTGFLSFGLWVHHMFATGIPRMSLGFFSAASMAVAVPSAIQVFAWLATLSGGRLRLGAPPTLFILGFLATFVIGGLTGVMLAAVPFDLVVHDTYFVVAHLHYVLFGGMVFPLFAAFYYWVPFVSSRPLSEKAGRWAFGLMFGGMNLAFFPMHIAGLAGMPRRVHTYRDALGWGDVNLLSTAGAFVLAAGVAVFLWDVARRFRFSQGENAGNLWKAGTLEWLPSDTYSVRSIPLVTSREPLWERPTLAREVEDGAWYLPRSATGGRETIVTSAVEARMQYVLLLPGAGWSPLVAAIGTAAFFLLLTVKAVAIAFVFAAVAIASIVIWLWRSDPGPMHAPVDVGGGIRLPTYMSGPDSHSWWAMLVLIAVAGTLYASMVFSYLYLWTVSPNVWPPHAALPPVPIGMAVALLMACSGACLWLADRALDRARRHAAAAALAVGTLLLGLATVLDLRAQLQAGFDPTQSSYAASVFALLSIQGFIVVVVAMMAAYCIARLMAGKLDATRRVTFDNTRLFWRYAVLQGLAGVAVVHGVVRLLVVA